MKLKKKLSGMTLVEVLVALVIFTMMALTFTTIFSYAARMNRENYILNQKFDQQVALAANGTSTGDAITVISDSSTTVKITYNGANTVTLPTEVYEVNLDPYGKNPTETDYDDEYEDYYNYRYFLTKYMKWSNAGESY